MEELTEGTTLAEIAHREGKGERQIRLLLPMAFTSPFTVRSIMDGLAPVTTVAALLRNIPLMWDAAFGPA
jgi:site-specific DNA recombinase